MRPFLQRRCRGGARTCEPGAGGTAVALFDLHKASRLAGDVAATMPGRANWVDSRDLDLECRMAMAATGFALPERYWPKGRRYMRELRRAVEAYWYASMEDPEAAPPRRSRRSELAGRLRTPIARRWRTALSSTPSSMRCVSSRNSTCGW